MDKRNIDNKPELNTNSEEHKILASVMEEKGATTFHEKLLLTLDSYKKGREIFLALNEELTNVRDRSDLVSLISFGPGNIFQNFCTSISLVDTDSSYHVPFCHSKNAKMDGYSSHMPHEQKYPLKNFLVESILHTSSPVPFEIENCLEEDNIPDYIAEYYELGMRAGITIALRSKMQTIGLIQVYAKRIESFDHGFKEIVLGISPQVSNAVSNILLNEESLRKKTINENLISMSNDLVSVRRKKDLLNVLNNGLRKMFNFSHSAISLVDAATGQYYAFLTGQESGDRDISKFSAAISEVNDINDGLFAKALSSTSPKVFDHNSVGLRNSPLWYRFNYVLGTRETLIKIIPNGPETGFAIMIFSDHTGTFDDTFIGIVDRIADQLSSVAMTLDNNERLQKRESEKTFLLDFSNELARIKNKEDLSMAVKNSLRKLNPVKMHQIVKINDDGHTASSYFHDIEAPAEYRTELSEIEKAKFSIHDGIQEKVLANSIPVVFNIEDEISAGLTPKYFQFWAKMNFERIVGTRLRIGNNDLGILWVSMDEINMVLLKGICAQISVALSNIIANEQVLEYKKRLEIVNNDLHQQIKTFYNFSEIIGNGPEMQKIYKLINIVSPSDTTVMISGETGTGKELIARAIHNSSPRKAKLMVKVNCAALPANLIESELFGHEKGSFTGAYERRIGKFELADGGTIFLDEIGEMPLDLQVKLLRILQERELERIGGKTSIGVNVRIIAATNRDLLAEVNAGRFRSDLFYRLNVFLIELPPLRSRPEDIEPLTNFFVERYSKLNGLKVNTVSSTVMDRLRNYTWPGNIRELEHLIERSILLSKDNVLRVVDLPLNIPEISRYQSVALPDSLRDAEREYILEILRECNGKISGKDGAAELLDLPASTLHSKMKKLGILRLHYAG